MTGVDPQGPQDGEESPAALKEDATEQDSALMDADRLMMQMIQLAMSLIGLGFTINAFFYEMIVRGAAADSDRTARRLGLALLCLGLVFLAMGVWNQARLRWSIRDRYKNVRRSGRRVYAYSAAPSFLLAIMLLVVGLLALASIALRSVVAS